MEIALEEIIEKIIIHKELNSKTNNYAFLKLTANQMAMVKKALLENEIVAIDPPYEPTLGREKINKTRNIIHDCSEQGIDELLERDELKISIPTRYPHATINILNLHLVDDKSKLQKLNQAIRYCNEGVAFNIFTTDERLKEYFTSNGKSLDYRDDLQVIEVKSLEVIL